MAEKRNKSEHLFEDYLTIHGYKFDYEQPAEGKSAKPDYRVPLNDGAVLYFDVKEFQQKLRDRPGTLESESVVSIVGYDPYKYVSAKLEDVWTQFSQYKEYSCSVVLYNYTHSLVVLTPEIVLGAMLGTLTNMTDSNGHLHQVFGEPGPYRTAYMYGADGPRETPISSVIVVESVIIVPTEFTQAHDKRAMLRSENCGSVAAAAKSLQHFMELKQQGIGCKTVPRVVVYENLHAAIQLSRDIFNGPFDERWGEIEKGKMGKIFEGQQIGEIDQPGNEFWDVLQQQPQKLEMAGH